MNPIVRGVGDRGEAGEGEEGEGDSTEKMRTIIIKEALVIINHSQLGMALIIGGSIVLRQGDGIVRNGPIIRIILNTEGEGIMIGAGETGGRVLRQQRDKRAMTASLKRNKGVIGSIGDDGRGDLRDKMADTQVGDCRQLRNKTTQGCKLFAIFIKHSYVLLGNSCFV